ncbi:hypothetical protein EVAR_12990_1 [Eumeta japonica]|uniref:Uncharacterized protein n=1 Tax=Eumeta variegata TaxID=151549 RepID=A0A4C1TWX4_EUMVA|nr:hypothetical protein EVAR_12990_1 [Eumeta japonica]
MCERKLSRRPGRRAWRGDRIDKPRTARARSPTNSLVIYIHCRTRTCFLDFHNVPSVINGALDLNQVVSSLEPPSHLRGHFYHRFYVGYFRSSADFVVPGILPKVDEKLTLSESEAEIRTVETMRTPEDRCVAVRFIVGEIKISTGSVHDISQEDLRMKRVSARRVPGVLADAQKQTRLNISRASLELFQDPSSFFG